MTGTTARAPAEARAQGVSAFVEGPILPAMEPGTGRVVPRQADRTDRHAGRDDATRRAGDDIWRMLAPMDDVVARQPPDLEAQTVGLPGPIAADLLEAAVCCSAGAYRAAGLLARRAVEQVAVLRRVPLEKRTLDQKIGWLLEAGHLPRTAVADARTVRDVGTAAVHGGEPLTEAEASAMIASALAVARAVFVES